MVLIISSMLTLYRDTIYYVYIILGSDCYCWSDFGPGRAGEYQRRVLPAILVVRTRNAQELEVLVGIFDVTKYFDLNNNLLRLTEEASVPPLFLHQHNAPAGRVKLRSDFFKNEKQSNTKTKFPFISTYSKIEYLFTDEYGQKES